MPLLPATGSEISMGRVRKAITTNTNPTTGDNIGLSGTLGVSVGQSAGTQITLSSTFGGKTVPYTY